MIDNNYLGNTNLNNYQDNGHNPNQGLCPNYSGLNSLANDVADTESQMGSLLSGINIGGPIGDDVYNVAGMNPDSSEFSEEDLNKALQTIADDIDKTQNLIDRINDQIEQNKETIRQNEQTITANENEITANEKTIEADKQVPEQICVGTEEDGNPIYEHNPDYDTAQQEIADLTARNEELNLQNETLREVNEQLKADNEALAEACQKYKELKSKKEDIQSKLQNISDYINGELTSDMADRFDDKSSLMEQLENMTQEEISEMVDKCEADIEALQGELKDTKDDLAQLQQEQQYSKADEIVKFHEDGTCTDEEYERIKNEKIASGEVTAEEFKAAEDRMTKINELEQKCVDISQAITAKNNVKDGLFLAEYNKYTQNDDFEANSNSRIASFEKTSTSGLGNNAREKITYTFYDADGNVIEPTDMEIATYFHNLGDDSQSAHIENMSPEAQKYYEAFKYLNDDNVAILNYLNNTGNSDAFNEYSDFMVDLSEKAHGQEMAKSIESQIDEIYSKIGTSWYDETTGGNKIEMLTVEDVMTLYAQWVEQKKLTYDYQINESFDGTAESFFNTGYKINFDKDF